MQEGLLKTWGSNHPACAPRSYPSLSICMETAQQGTCIHSIQPTRHVPRSPAGPAVILYVLYLYNPPGMCSPLSMLHTRSNSPSLKGWLSASAWASGAHVAEGL